MRYLTLILLCLSLTSFAGEGVYFGAAFSPTYGSGETSAKSSLSGIGVGISGGVRIQSVGIEFGAKRFTLTNDPMGDSSYDSELKNSLFYGGGRLFLNKIFSLKAGLAMHQVEMDLKQGSSRLTSEEEDGDYIGLYGGMGILHPLNQSTDLYYEATLYPVPDIGFYFVDFEFGLRWYL